MPSAIVFMPQRRSACARTASACGRASSREEGLELLGWRDVPVDNSLAVGRWSAATEPVHRQVFIGRPTAIVDAGRFRAASSTSSARCVSNAIQQAYKGRDIGHYTVSLSSRTLVYKGMFLSYQVRPTTPTCPTRASSRRWRWCTSASRPTPSRRGSWRIPTAWSPTTARSTRCAATSTGWRRAQASVSSPLFGDDIAKLWPISYEGQSDTACFDNALEFLVMGGYTLPHAAMMLIPEAWAGNPLMDRKRRAFYEYHACLMEPWDGPAAMAFTDGRQIGATLDRNGLRPARYFVTKDDLVIMSSEAGVLPVAGGEHRAASGGCSRARCC